MITISPLTRVQLLGHIPQGGTAAEIGVWNGAFARHIFSIVKPTELHLVDPWGGSEDPYVREYSISEDMQAKFESVKAKFSNEIANKRIFIHRTTSIDWASTIADGSLDWLYLDGLHTYDAVAADLKSLDTKVKPDGLILGHDFSNYRKRTNFGVVEAVRQFVAERGYKVILITGEDAPSFAISKAPDGKAAHDFLSKVISADPRVVQIHDRHFDEFDQVPYNLPSGERRFLMRFGAQ